MRLIVDWHVHSKYSRACSQNLTLPNIAAMCERKGIDVVATALHAGMTIEQMTSLDLAYAPPFSPVWDPVLVAARQVATMVGS